MSLIDRQQAAIIKEEDRKKRNALDQVAEDIKAREAQKIQDRYDKIKDRIKELHDQKHELLRGPITKEEVLTLAKDRLVSNQKDFAIEKILRPHLENCQKRKSFPFDPGVMRVWMFPPDKCWQLGYFAFTEEDIEEAIKLLPDIGMSQEEREAKIEEIEQEISQLSDILEKELKGE